MDKTRSHYKAWYSSSDSSSGSDVCPATRGIRESKAKISSNVDVITVVAGDFGLWQFWICLSMALLKLSSAWYQMNIIFMAPLQEFWCEKPQGFEGLSDEEWRRKSKPIVEEEPCFIFNPELLAVEPSIERRLIPLVRCKKFIYDSSSFNRTIVSDWDLVCEKHWLVHLTQCVMMTGILIGGIYFGMLADSYGRKRPLIVSLIIQSAASFISALCTWFWLFLLFWFILALACGGVAIISFVICLEAVGGKWRDIMPVLYQAPFGLGSAVMALLAYYYRDWRKVEIGLASLSALYILYWFWIPESPRWLFAHGQPEQAVEILYKAAKRNNRKEWTIKKIKKILPDIQPQIHDAPPFIAFVKSRNMRLKTVILSLDWFIAGLAFYSFSAYLGQIGGDIFVMISVTGIISVFGPIVCVFVVLFNGRKVTIWIFQAIAGLCFFIIIFLPTTSDEYDWPRIAFAGVGFAAMAAYIPTLYLFTGELYPTLGRNKGVGVVTMFARLGSMVAPCVVAMDSYYRNMPLMLLVVLSIGQLWLLMPLPETKNCPLPNTIEEAEMMEKPRKKVTLLFYCKNEICSTSE